MIEFTELREVFEQAGFQCTFELKRTAEFRRKGQTVYVVKDSLISGKIHIVMEEQPSTSTKIMQSGVVLGKRYHSSNMYQFPIRLNRGKKPIHFGTSVWPNNQHELDCFLHAFGR